MQQHISLTIFLFSLMLVMFISTNQDAAGLPDTPPTLTVSPDCTDQEITQFTLNGSNWPTEETIQLVLDNQLLTARAPAHSGDFSLTWKMPSPQTGGHIIKAISDSFYLSTPLWIGCEDLSNIYLPLIVSSQTKNPPSHTAPPLNIQFIESLTEDRLAFNEFDTDTDLHQYEVMATETLTISVASNPVHDIFFTLIDTTNDHMIGQNMAAGDEVETAVFTNLDPAHNYLLTLNNPSHLANDYKILIWGDEGLQLEAKDILNYGEVASATIPASDWIRQFYFFYGEAGDIVSIKTTTTTSPPNNDPVMLISVYDVDGNYLEHDGDEVLWFDVEVNDIHLPKTGLYTIWLEELSYEMADYTVTVTKE